MVGKVQIGGDAPVAVQSMTKTDTTDVDGTIKQIEEMTAPVCDLETGEVLGVTTDVLDLGNETVRYGIAKRASKLRELLQKL